MIPGPDLALSDAVRSRCANDARMLVKEVSFARLFFDAAVRRMVAASGVATTHQGTKASSLQPLQ